MTNRSRRDFLAATTATGLVSALGHGQAAAMEPGAGGMAAEGPWPIRGSESFEIDSKAVKDKFSIGVWKPDPAFLKAFGRADKPLELVYVLDGSWALGVAAAASMLQLADLIKPGFPPLMLVGIDYPEGRMNARTRDYTMADSVSFPGLGTTPETTPGGADRFLEFLETELDPLIRSRYGAARRTSGILGDSFGGTFTFYAFLKQSKLFDRYWLGSPGIFTTKSDYVGRFGALLDGQLAHPTKMFLSLGELEASGGVALYQDMGANFGRLEELIARKANKQLESRSRRYPGHTHTSVLLPSINDALLYLYGPHFPG